MLAKRIATITCLATFAVLVGFSVGSTAHATEATCPPPLMTCSNSSNGDACPTGYECTCVPSCPICRDCPARVCVVVAGEKCRTSCDCATGTRCFEGACLVTDVPVFCCERGRCPAGFPCETSAGIMQMCPGEAACRTACDCDPGLGCFDGQCIAGFAPVYCCNGDTCPSGEQCQHRSGEMDRCAADVEGACERLDTAASNHIERIIKRASRCRSNEECVRVDTTTQCQGTCGAWINARYQRNFDRVLSYVDRRICTQHHDLGCPYSTPRCVNETGVCERGRCRGQFVQTQTR